VKPVSRDGSGRPAKDAGQEFGSLGEHKREIVALVLVGLSIFLFVALYAGDAAGAGGRGVRDGLVYAFGALAFFVPVALLAVATTTVLQRSFWHTYRFAGIALLILGLFVLVAAGAPPIASHGPENFVRETFEGRAGGLGEALYAGLHSGIGTVGVAIVGWLVVLVGLILATGLTGVWLAARSRRVADAVKRQAERSARSLEERRQDPGRAADVGSRGGESGKAGRATPHLGPVDLVGSTAADPRPRTDTGARQPFGDSFEEWGAASASGTEAVKVASTTSDSASTRAVLDGAQAFSDIYEEGKDASSSSREVAGRSKSGGGGHANESGGDTTTSSLSSGDDATAETVEADGARLRRVTRDEDQPAYLLPEAAVLRKSASARAGKTGEERDVAAVLLEALAQFGVEARIIGTVVGPRVTRYELQLAPGTKVAKITGLRDDLAYALASTEIRILAPIPGKSAVGVEVPNQRPDFVTLGDIYRELPKSSGPLMVWLGKDISGKAVYADLTKLPHLLIAGTTGSGKSGCVNCLVSSVLLRSTPEQVRMIMVDPKKVELSHYDRIPHLLVPVVTNMKDAAGVLHNVVKEMEDRYELLGLDHARSLAEANKARAERGEAPLPYLLIVIDELADLMMTSPQEVEDYVIRLAQKSRAVGIHLVVATQRPSADVITGMIKANIPSRIAFAVSSQTDSRVILDVNGAESLLGMGDMLFKPLGSSHLQRVQGAYITEEEIAALVGHWRRQAEPEFREELLRRPPDPNKKPVEEGVDPDSDELLTDAARLVLETGSASVSLLQRRLRVGYTRAGRLIDMLERRGIVGPWEGSKPRQILIQSGELETLLAGLDSERAEATLPAEE